MLFTLIYRSHITENFPIQSIKNMVSKASKLNHKLGITGILLFNGTHFFQLLEGPEQDVVNLFDNICTDKRHHGVVELMRDYAPSRRFGNTGMELFDLRDDFRGDVLEAVLDRGTSRYRLTYDDRALQFLRTFSAAHERENYYELPVEGTWTFVSEGEQINLSDDHNEDFTFAFQPMIDPLSQRVTAVEALLCKREGGGPELLFADMTAEERCQTDLSSKALAFSLAGKLGIGRQTLCVNLAPETLLGVPDIAQHLLRSAEQAGLTPEQIVVGVMENEVAIKADLLTDVVRTLRSAGLRLAINNFGAGAGSLLLLSRFQPERIKLDAALVRDVHRSGPKQAILLGLLRSCTALEIAVTASGIEKPEEWMWLEAAGVSSFQGDLFANAVLNGMPSVAWPEPV